MTALFSSGIRFFRKEVNPTFLGVDELDSHSLSSHSDSRLKWSLLKGRWLKFGNSPDDEIFVGKLDIFSGNMISKVLEANVRAPHK